ncbi:hypothetical protein KC842_02350 [Candidatus Nomurabacteria bacterium]|nr:hypothetical protein [Candidatus Nomurabacteria bacterium]
MKKTHIFLATLVALVVFSGCSHELFKPYELQKIGIETKDYPEKIQVYSSSKIKLYRESSKNDNEEIAEVNEKGEIKKAPEKIKIKKNTPGVIVGVIVDTTQEEPSSVTLWVDYQIGDENWLIQFIAQKEETPKDKFLIVETTKIRPPSTVIKSGQTEKSFVIKKGENATLKCDIIQDPEVKKGKGRRVDGKSKYWFIRIFQ